MKKSIIIFTILLIVSSCKMTKVTYKKPISNQNIVLSVNNTKSFDDAEAWFDSIHNRPIKIDNLNIAQKYKEN